MATSRIDTSVPPAYERQGAYSPLEPTPPVLPTTIPAAQPKSEVAVIHQQTWARRNRGKIIGGTILVCAIALIFGLAFGLTHKPDHKDHDSKTHSTGVRLFRPKTVDGVTPLAAVWTNDNGTKIFTQNNATGYITVSALGKGGVNMTQEIIKPNLAASNYTPLAAVAWDGGKEIRLFYFSDDSTNHTRTLQEYSWSASTGVWAEGSISTANIQAYNQSKVAATFLPSTNQVRLYYESTAVGNIQELSYNITNNSGQKWDAINYPHSSTNNYDLSLDSGSDIAAITVNGTELRLYSVRNGDISEMSWPTSDGVNVPIHNINWVTTTSNINVSYFQPYYVVPKTPITAVRWEGNGSANTLAFQHVLYYELPYSPTSSVFTTDREIEISDIYKVPQKLDTTGSVSGPGKASWKGSVFGDSADIFGMPFAMRIVKGSKMVALAEDNFVSVYFHAGDGVRSIIYDATKVLPVANSQEWWRNGSSSQHVPKDKY